MVLSLPNLNEERRRQVRLTRREAGMRATRPDSGAHGRDPGLRGPGIRGLGPGMRPGRGHTAAFRRWPRRIPGAFRSAVQPHELVAPHELLGRAFLVDAEAGGS